MEQNLQSYTSGSFCVSPEGIMVYLQALVNLWRKCLLPTMQAKTGLDTRNYGTFTYR